MEYNAALAAISFMIFLGLSKYPYSFVISNLKYCAMSPIPVQNCTTYNYFCLYNVQFCYFKNNSDVISLLSNVFDWGNKRSAGSTIEERQSFEENFLDKGFVDTFRKRLGVVGYTYWGYHHGTRKTNKGNQVCIELVNWCV